MKLTTLFSFVVTTCVGLTGCLVELELPDAAKISCAVDGDCPSGRCALPRGICLGEGETADTTPPVPQTVSALNDFTLELAFDEPLDLAGDPPASHYAIAPASGAPAFATTPIVTAAVFSSDARQVVHVTIDAATPHTPGVSYELTVSGLADEWLNAMVDPVVLSYVSFGDAPDESPPNLYSPPGRGVVFPGAAGKFSWSARRGAERYDLQVVSDPLDPDNTEIYRDDDVGGTACLDEPPSVEVPTPCIDTAGWPPVDYWWRVKTDISVWSDWWLVSLADPDAVYVAVSSASPLEIGNRSSPHVDIARAQLDAYDVPAGSALVAREIRLSVGDYVDVIRVGPSQQLVGGWAWDTATATWTTDTTGGVTRIIAPDDANAAIYGTFAVDAGIASLAVSNTSATPAPTNTIVGDSAAVVLEAAQGFRIDDCEIRAGAGGLSSAGIRILSSDDVLITNTTVVGGGDVSSWPTALVVQQSLDVVVEDSVIMATDGVQAYDGDTAGIRYHFATGAVRRTVIWGGEANANRVTYGLIAEYATLEISGNLIHNANPNSAVAAPNVMAIGIRFRDFVPVAVNDNTTIVNNVIISEPTSSYSDGIWREATGGAGGQVRSFATSGDTYWDSPHILVGNNTFVLRNDLHQFAFAWPTREMDVRNNLIVAASSVSGWESGGFGGVWGGADGEPPLTDNIIVIPGAGTLANHCFFKTSGGFCVTGVGASDSIDAALAAQLGSTTPTGNTTSTQSFDQIFALPGGDDFHLAVGSDAETRGNPLPPEFGVTTDRDGVVRPATGPWAVGAYEP